MLLTIAHSVSDDPSARKAAGYLAVLLLGISLGTLVILTGFVILWRKHVREHSSIRASATRAKTDIDPWTEAGKRVNADDFDEPDVVDPDSHTRSSRRITHNPRFDPPLPPLSQRLDDEDVDDSDDDDANDQSDGPTRTPPRHGGPSR